jgi:hypothetical protein
MEYDILNNNEELEDFGGQNQIVNTQEQNREVNPGGLTQTDKEETLYGKEEDEDNPDQEKVTDPSKDKDPSKQKDKDSGTRKKTVEAYS